MTRWIRRLLMTLVLLALVGAIVYAFLPKPVPADVAEVSRGPLRVTVDEDGKTRIREKYVVSAPLAGRLRRITLDPGDEVIAGKTVVALIEPTDPSLLDARARAEAAARVQAAEAAVARTDPALESALAAMQNAESEYARGRQLAKTNAISRSELDQLELNERQRTQEYRQARFAVEIAQFELEQARAALIRTEPDSESTDNPDWQFEIDAPISGEILRVFQESATVVTPGTQLVEVGDPTNLEVEVDVLSSDAVKIRPGDEVFFEHWGGDEPLPGVVRLVEPAAFTKISALGVEEQRVWVIIDLTLPPDKRPQLGDGYRVEARIVIWSQPDVVRVPTSALFRTGEDWSVFRVVDGRAELRPVKIGQRNGLEAEVLEGLDPGDRVVVHPSDRVEDGVQIAVR